MPYLLTSQQWLHQSSLLLQAYPSSTKITTKYSITPPASKPSPPTTTTTTNPPLSTQAQQPARGSLILKAYDPISGVCLKYRTDKAAEVGRLIGSLGMLGRGMCGLGMEASDKEPEIDTTMADAPPAPAATAAEQGTGTGAGTSTPVPEVVKDGKGGGGAKGGKKKKGKK